MVARLSPALTPRPSGLATAPAATADVAAAPCLIVNPLSFRASRGLADEASAVARAHGAEVMRVDTLDSIGALVDTLLAQRQRRVIVLGGDGTVREVVDRLAQLPAGHWLPDLLVLPGGRSNLVAADLVPGETALATLRRALAAARDGRWDAAVVERVPLCVAQEPAPPRYGFVLGGAAVDSVVRRTRDHRYGAVGAFRTSHFTTPWMLLKLALLGLVGRTGLRSPDLHVDAGAAGSVREPVRLLLATTLLHRSGSFDPYASRGSGDLRLTAVTRRARRFWLALPRLLTGRYSKTMNADNGYLSGSCERVQIDGLDGYVLDGEPFDTDPTRPVVITPGPRLRFLAP